MKKVVAISIPCWNEEENVEKIAEAIQKQFEERLQNYDFYIQFIDNCSTDSTREILKRMCLQNKHVRAIFNASNVSGSAIHGILQTDGDCCIHMACDFQDPPELIPELVTKWESGARVVYTQKTSSEENGLMWRIRTIYYKIMEKFSAIEQIEHFTGFGLYDRTFVEIIRKINDPLITLRGIVAEYADKVEVVRFVQPKRKHGISSKKFMNNFDYAMRTFTTYTKVGVHIITLVGVAGFFLGIVVGICGIVRMCMGMSFSMVLLISFILILWSIIMGALGLVGSYIINMNIRLLNRPLAIEADRLGFDNNDVIKPENISPYEVFEPLEDNDDN